MTIVVRRRGKKETKFERAIRTARMMSAHKLASTYEFLDKEEKRQDKLRGAAIRRYAKKHGFELSFHRKEWIFRAQYGGIELPAGYFAWIDGVLHKIVAS